MLTQLHHYVFNCIVQQCPRQSYQGSNQSEFSVLPGRQVLSPGHPLSLPVLYLYPSLLQGLILVIIAVF